MAGMQKEGKKFSLSDFIDGSFLNRSFFKRQYKLLLLLVLLAFVYISNHYAVIMKIAEIDRLKAQLTEIKYEALYFSSELMQESRQSHIKAMVEEKGLDLKESTMPPYQMEVEE